MINVCNNSYPDEKLTKYQNISCKAKILFCEKLKILLFSLYLLYLHLDKANNIQSYLNIREITLFDSTFFLNVLTHKFSFVEYNFIIDFLETISSFRWYHANTFEIR